MSVVKDEQVVAFAAERPHLRAVAFRILGSEADAEDVVQEAWARYARCDVDDLRNIQAWLTTVVTRLCIDLLRRTREAPRPDEDLVGAVTSGDGPEEVAVLAAELTEAFVVVLARLSPEQRVALVLHDVFGMPFDDVARVLATTAGSAKKLASRARGRLRAGMAPDRRATVDVMAARRVVGAFLAAAQEGDVEGLVAILHPEISRTADPQALPPGASQRVEGVEAVVAETRALQATARSARLASINGRPGIAITSAGNVVAAMVVHVADGLVRHYDVVADPGRLTRLRIDGCGA